jgi:type II secretory pathway pseudopilin PulG
MSFTPASRRRPQRGYIMLTLMLAVALMAIAAGAIAPALAFRARRDREEELIHRGVQYSRAVRRFFKKFGRYPTSLDELESVNNMRFLRRRYKDPITNQDFKLLHFGEVQMAMGAGVVGASSPGTAIGTGPAGTAQSKQFSLGSASANANPANNQTSNNQANGSNGADATSGDSQEAKAPGEGQTFGGGPIVGVVSTSKSESIREFNNKNHYNQWQFIYDPSTDRGGLLNTPNQPPLQNAVLPTGAPNPPGANGFGVNGTTGAPGGFGSPNPGQGNGMTPFGQQTPAPMHNQPQQP